ncbi:T9SS type A sorting domain-containing protein [Algibacter mikhailovii]|uniref:CBM6 domain-containing protein n=1 Tax=Algibacter mikhailovii TaxID=425498 RepID=A0A918R7B0_9FLAO|nr:T9SS type A sorting domain-containing protein [Algibacter mikhailovii]GGZ87405.1 hypothetical protein GCM10007028_26990 [Algibacter mikhailovii]
MIRKILCNLLIICTISTVSFAQLDTKIEAEDTTNFTELSGTTVLKPGTGNASGPSGGAWVLLKNGPNGSLKITVNSIPNAGSYKLNIYYFNNAASQNVDFKVNDVSETLVLSPSNWEYQGLAQRTSVDVNLNVGTNTFTFTRMTQNIHLDYFTVTTEIPAPIVHTYYVSNDGNDANDGISESTPWKTLTKASSVTQSGGLLQPGGKLLFNKGDTFIGQLIIGCSGTEENPIEIGSYGTGDKPILTGVGANMGNNNDGDAAEVIKMTNTSHILMNDLHITNDRKVGLGWNGSGNKSYGIYLTANKWGGRSKGLTFRNLEFVNIYGVDMINWEGVVDTENYKAQAFFFDSQENHDGSTEPGATEVGIDDVLIENCYFKNLGGSGITIRHLGGYDSNGPSERNQNYIIRNNHFEDMGGDGVVFASVYNGLVENNEYHDIGLGDKNNASDRLFGRGEGCWIWDSWNIIVQYNKQYRNKGFGDTYGAGGHVDFFCKDVIFQYNYSEDTDGGFVEILGDCDNTTFRHNVSVNDGHRTAHHNYTIWLSGYVGTGKTPVPSRNNYVYNNTVYVNNAALTPQISIFAEDTYIYNNVFMYLNGSSMGIRNEDGVNGFLEDMQNGGVLEVSNNMFQGNINASFKNKDNAKLDNAWPSFSSPPGKSPGDANGSSDIYDISNTSVLKDAGKQFTPPVFPMAGQGIFANITSNASDDGFGNAVNPTKNPNIGASNSHNSNVLGIENFNELPKVFKLFPNPVKEDVNIQILKPISEADVSFYDVQGRFVYGISKVVPNQNMKIELPNSIKNGIYFIRISDGQEVQTTRFILYR